MHILNPFPELLWYGFFAPTLLRVAAAFVFAYIAYAQITRYRELAPVLGIAVWIGIALEAIVALCLFLGYYTQIAALGGIAISLLHFAGAKRYARAVPLCRADFLFLIVILLSLLLSGAGALAFDLPL